MLPKTNRLKSDKDFRNVFKNGKTSENQFFRVKFLKNQKNFSRFGFIISAKLLKKATARNVLKRRLRMICKLLLKDLKSGFDIVIWPKTNSTSLNYKSLTDSLRELIILNKIINDKT
ncbi:MAG: Ribonuclease P protein component [Candidatus Yanofskybacteria bacterium GW2011_GWC2_41_9]|uniref:Ribonuclease P protein component n=1 Tax=Candidatus Yanofskybacteria bacterium GW2011_GWC2_41_9 TaxID=1619029 RepID=A0A0G0ZZC0_9BACT|nr:MAG: Ribonuclease P protein component [Candidatus Yanofskybacteria bacterium GW2011_GWC2_41_9]